MKAVILAAGRGKRLEETTGTAGNNKCMLKLNGRHLIEYSLETAILAEVAEILVVVGYRAEDIINTYGIQYESTAIRYIFQDEQRGLVHAMEQAREGLEGEDFMLLLADEILIGHKPLEMIRRFEEEGLFVMCGVTAASDRSQISNTYSVIYNPENNMIYRLIEKPRHPVNDIMGTGNCLFRNAIFDFIPYTPINYFRGEKELPDLIQCAIDEGKPVQLFPLEARYVNINTPEDIIQARQMFEGE